MHDIGKGLIAGLIATVVVAIAILVQGAVGLVPGSDVIAALTRMFGQTWPGTGWVVLFVAGGVIGMGFASLDAHVEHVTGVGEIVRA